MSDEKIIENAVLGDVECIRLLIDKWYPLIRAFCYRCIKNITEADDLTQEVFLKVIVALPNYNEQGNFKSWLFKIAANTCKDYYKQKKINLIPNIEDKLFDDDFANHVTERELLQNALNLLPYKHKESIILHYYNQFTLQEIGDILHIPKSTVNTRIRRGLALLQIILKESEHEYRKEIR